MTWAYAAIFCMVLSDFCKDVESEAYSTRQECKERLSEEVDQWVKLGWTVRTLNCKKKGMRA